MSKRSREEENAGSSKEKSRRGEKKRSNKLFLVEVLDDDGTVFNIIEHKLKRRGKILNYIVAQNGAEFRVRLTIFSEGWKIHRWDYFHATLLIDGSRVRSRYIKKPENVEEETVYVWDNNQDGFAFKFAHRNSGRKIFSSKYDGDCGVITVEMKAAEGLDYHHRERMRKYRRFQPSRNHFKSARNVQMSDATKEKHSILRIVEGRRIFWLPEDGSATNPPPAKLVSDYVYASLTLFYDEAEHLEYRGILKPTFCKEHRIYFPTRDFRKLKQLRRERVASRPVVGDLTGDDDCIVWRREENSGSTEEEWESIRNDNMSLSGNSLTSASSNH